MKKIILIFISLLYISCSGLDTYVNGETKNAITMKGVTELMTEKEKQDLNSGKETDFILYKDPFRGVLAQVLKVTADALPHKKEIEEAANYIYKYQDKIIISDNTKIIQEAIEYMGTTEKGRKTLPKCRFVFLNYVNREKIQELSTELGFKYSYPKVEDIK